MSGFTQGDRVVIVRSGAGTWQTLGIYDAEDLVKIDKNMSLESAATFQVIFLFPLDLLFRSLSLCSA